MKISYLENNSHLCNLLFTNANIFKNPYEGFAYLSYSEILFNLLKFHSQKNNNANYNLIILNILTNISLDEVNDLFNCMNKRLFHDYNLIEFFLSILIKYFSFLKIKEEYINQKMFDMIDSLTKIKNLKKEKELIKEENFRKMTIKIIFLLLNSKGTYNINNSNEYLKNINSFLYEINSNNDEFKYFLNELFIVFFKEFYIIQGVNITEKFIFISNKNELSDFNLKPINSTLFSYLEKVINLFCSFYPTINIINEIIYYLFQVQYSYYQIYLQEYRLLVKDDGCADGIHNKYFLCTFHHLFKSKIIHVFIFYLFKFAKNKNSPILKLFPDFKKLLINVFNLCPCPSYFNLFFEILQNEEQLKENVLYLDEILEMIINNEFLELNYDLNNLYSSKYKIKFYNIIKILKCFFYLSIYQQINSQFCLRKIMDFFFKFVNFLKKCKIIYSNYLITLDINNEKFQKTLIEICYLISISLLSKKNYSSQLINQGLELFENRDRNSKEFGQSLFYIFDMLNKGNDIKDISNYQNEDFSQYLSELNYPKEEKSLLIISFINLIILINKIDKLNNLKTFVIKDQIMIFNEIMVLFKKTYEKFQRTKSDYVYNLIIEQIYSIKKNKLSSFDDKLMNSFTEIINKNIKKFKGIEPINNINNMLIDEKTGCFLKNNCLLLKSRNNDINKNNAHSYNFKDPKIFGDYFDIDLVGGIKYFKSDLIFKDCSIFFDNIFYNDKNFDILKKSFLIKNKNILIGESDRPMLTYPSKLKNYSNNKYSLPKLFLDCDIKFYKSKYFHICHPQFNLSLLKKDSFPNFPSHYEYFDDLYKKYIFNNTFTLNCEFISVKNIIVGKIYICSHLLLFKNVNNFDEKNLLYILHSDEKDNFFNKKIISINYKDIEEIITRAFAYSNQAIEIFLKDGKSYFFNLYKEEFLINFYQEIKKIKSKFPKLNFTIIEDSKYAFEQYELTKKWENHEISTYQYLLYINKYSGRTYNDLNQYPIFPWIFLESKKDNNKFLLNLRDMKYFMVTQFEKGRKMAKDVYKKSEEEKKNIHHFLIHYSTSAYILFYLVKISPFTEGQIRLQDQKFDTADRLLNSFDVLVRSITNSKDNRELIPELFTSVENLFNLNYNFFGLNAQKKLLHNAIIPEIFNSPEQFIYFNRLILNNQNKLKFLPKCEINKWIDNIFGINQYPGEFEKLNKFDNYAYRQIKSINKQIEKYIQKKYTIEQIIKAIDTKIKKVLNFGQCPIQLFKIPHTSVKNKEKKETNCQIKKILDFVNINTKIVTFWLNESKSLYFLIKNKLNKKMSVLIFDDKLNKKNEIIIDKIKLFCCTNDFFSKEIVFNKNENLNCSISMDILAQAEIYNSFLVLDEDLKKYENPNMKDNYTMKDLCDAYALDPKSSMFDFSDDINTYLFVGRNYDNSIKIYTQSKSNNQLIGQLKTDSFVSVICKINKEFFITGHFNGKLLEWKIKYKEVETRQSNELRQKKINKITIIKEFYAHNCMISCIYYNERHDIVISSDIKGILYIRKYYDFQLINKIVSNQNGVCFINKILINEYDIICTINYNIYKNKNYISFYSINGILLEESKNNIIIDISFLKNGKLIFNCLNESKLFIFGFNDKDKNDNTGKMIIEDKILKDFDVKKNNLDYIKNFIIEKNDIYILLKNGLFMKGCYEKLDSLSFGIENFKQ